jgi:hypothetical protein
MLERLPLRLYHLPLPPCVSGADDAFKDNRSFILVASSEIRKRHRLRTPFVMQCAGIFPSRASRFTVIGEHLRNTAASSAVTKGSCTTARSKCSIIVYLIGS